MGRLIIGLAICLALGACKTTEDALKEAGNKPLTSAQIKKLYDNTTAVGTTSSGRSFEVKFKSDGTAFLNSGSINEPGKWWVEGKDIYCSQWTTVRNGAKRCLRLYNIGEKYQSVQLDGTASSTFTVQ